MRRFRLFRIESMIKCLTLIAILLASGCERQEQTNMTEPLPSWNDGKTKSSIINFVKDVADKNSANYVAPENRIATFDNDGCLWSEKPFYFQLFFAIDRIKSMAEEHPGWKTEQPFKAVLENDMDALLASGMNGILKLVMASHAGMTTNQFTQIVKEWTSTVKHPKTNKLYKEMVFQPMLELLDYLRANEFKTYIVSGGGIQFLRVWAEEVYGIPPEQVIGSSIKTRFEFREGKPVIVRLPELDFIDDKEGKPIAINNVIGKRPIAAFGNSDGDLPMLQWVSAGDGARFVMYVHHTDAEREWAYDRKSHVGRLDKGLDEAIEKGWTIVDMKNDWKVIYPFDLTISN